MGGNSEHAKNLYAANLKLSQAFHPLLGIFEVALRNSINDILTKHFADPDWIQTQKTGFMIDPSLTFKEKQTGLMKTNSYLKDEIEKAERRLRKTGTPITSGKIISEQSLGFWTDMFEVYHYRLLRGKPIQIFPTLPPGIGRRAIHMRLEQIRVFRNRIHHNEPVCFRGLQVDLSLPITVHEAITNILSWIDDDLAIYLGDFDSVHQTISEVIQV